MQASEFDFDLPPGRIALRPARPRDSARLLVVRPDGSLEHHHVRDLPGLLAPKDILVVNDSKVFPARLFGRRKQRPGQDGSPPKIEVLLHRRVLPSSFRALARPARKLMVGDEIQFPGVSGTVTEIGQRGDVGLTFDLSGQALDEVIAAAGEIPLPPYIAGARPVDHYDSDDYQTIFAREPGSVAAPTAGLHFTKELLGRLSQRGVQHATVTLQVGPGTFLPVTASDTDAHVIQAEYAELSDEAARAVNAARRSGGRVVAVGSTSLRTLESAASPDGTHSAFAAETELFITPGYRFRAADVLITNFHLPRSTLFMLVCAFAGLETMKRAYAEAIAREYRFYSYGDACLLFRAW